VSVARAITRGVGELFITAGAVILLFCVYQLFWTNVTADHAADQVTDQLRHQWAEPPLAAVPSTSPTPRPASIPMGDALALIHIPRLGADYVKPVVQGVDLPDLARGIGHYPDTAMPGKIGNFAVAGHRATNGEPLKYIDKIKNGDKVVVETATTWFTYVVDRHIIVQPTDTWVLDPVPGKPGVEPTQALITLTSCEPRWASYRRWIVFGHLESTLKKSDGVPPALQAQGD
jgi:sortase A